MRDELRTVFTFLNQLEKQVNRRVFCDTQKLYEIQISVHK